MKKAFIITLFIFGIGHVLAQSYTPLDAGSSVKFTIKNFGMNTGGSFKGLAGSIHFDAANISVMAFDVSIDAKTIDTDMEARDNHLRKAEYFDVAAYPRITFKSAKVTGSQAAGTLYMYGSLSVKGVTKDIKFPFKASVKEDGILFEGEFKINRRDFNVGGKSLSLSDEVIVSLSVFAKKN